MKKIVVTLALLWLGVINAQDTKDPDQKIPIVNNHSFISTNELYSPFVNTNLQTNIGFGITSLVQIKGVEIDGTELGAFEGRLLYIDFDLQYQQKFNDWLALYFTLNLTSRVGTDMSTILVDGLNTVNGGDIGWLIKLKETEKFYLSGTIKANAYRGSFINVTEYLEEIIDDEPYPTLTKKTPVTSIGGGLRGAYAFNPSYGLQFNAEISHGESFERTASDTYYSLGLLGDVDLKHTTKTPIAFGVGYTLTSSPEITMNNRGVSNIISGKIGYSGSKDFELGAQYSYLTTNLKSVNNATSVNKILLGIKFYF